MKNPFEPAARPFSVFVTCGAGQQSFAEETLEVAVKRARAYVVSMSAWYRDKWWAETVKVDVLFVTGKCRACSGSGTKVGRDGRYRDCRTCRGTAYPTIPLFQGSFLVSEVVE